MEICHHKISLTFNRLMFAFASAVFLCHCSSAPMVNIDDYEDGGEPNIYPAEYKNALIPCNIGPMNFQIKENRASLYADLFSANYNVTLKADEDGIVKIPVSDWKKLKEGSEKIGVQIRAFDKDSATGKDKCYLYQEFSFIISKDSIDKYLTYRLIEPSYQASGKMGLFAYDIENCEETPIVTVSKQYSIHDDRNQMCVNCHHTQKKKDGISMFYYRGKTGGLIVTNGKEIKKINTKVGDLAYGTSYSSIHPTKPYIAMSSALTRQMFHLIGNRKLDVFDWASDLVLYDFEKNSITNIIRTKDKQESFPEWSVDGKSLFYVSTDTVFNFENYQDMKYELMQIDFDETSKSWSNSRKILSFADRDSSVTMPKVSPNGKYLALTRSKFGVSTQTNQTADLILMDLSDSKLLDTRILNSDEADSYHSWSSNSKWMVLASRRGNGNYMRLYLFHVGDNGELSSPFVVPRTNPLYYHYFLKSYNVPELVTSLPKPTECDYEKMMLDVTAQDASFDSKMDSIVDGHSSASQIVKP